MVFLDFDGVMTDNRVLVMDDGREAVVCNRADGQGIAILREKGIPCMIISTETNLVVTHRALKLGLLVMQSVKDKAGAVKKVCARLGIDPQQTVFVGNDVNDLPALRVVGHRLCPRDAVPEVRRICNPVLRTAGGHGVVRELAARWDSLF